MVTQNLEVETPLGFIDITEGLEKRAISQFYKYDVIRNILVDRIKEENHKGEKVSIGNFFVQRYGIRGRVFSLDEIIQEMIKYDIIIQNFKKENNFPPINIDAHIYHDLYPGEKIPIKVSRKKEYGNPSFKLFNHIGGFIKDWGSHSLYKCIDIGTKVLVEVKETRKPKKGHYMVMTKPLEILSQ